MEKQFPSARYPQIRYTPGEEIWVDDLLPDRGRPFYFDVGEEVTRDEELVRAAAEALDHMEELEERARGFLRAALEDGDNPRHKVIDYFLKEHLTEMDDESLSAMLGVEDPLALSQRELLDMLVLQRFGNTMLQPKLPPACWCWPYC